MIQETRTADGPDGTLDFVQFHAAGERAGGEYRCADCGYGVTLWTTLPRCPMCSGASWQRSAKRRSRAN